MKINLITKNWDTEFFGLKVIEVLVSQLTEEELPEFYCLISQHDTKLAYILPKDKLSAMTIEEKIVKRIDTKVTFLRNINSLNINTNITSITSYRLAENYAQLLNLALESGKYSRFRKDSNFEKGAFEELYSTWIKNSINKHIADDVLVNMTGTTITGFITYKISKEILIIGLIAVDKNFQRKGIGKSLIDSIENIAITRNCKKVLVSTQKENKEAMRFYFARGYCILSEQAIYHLWL